jgi:6,7-dimethyl-8-ribityllumazine synthase
MPREFRGECTAPEGSIGIVVSRYNSSITSKLLAGAVETLQAAGVDDDAIDVVWVPVGFEIPLAAQQMAESGLYLAVLCLGAVIRGETTHDQHINRAVSLGVTEVGLSSSLPVLFGLLTCDTLEQAIQRSGGNVGNKGRECAEAALEMISLLNKMESLKEN